MRVDRGAKPLISSRRERKCRSNDSTDGAKKSSGIEGDI